MSTKKSTRTSRDHEFAQEIGAMGGRAKAAKSKSNSTSKKTSTTKKNTRTARDHEFAQEIGAMGGRAKARNNSHKKS